MSYIQYIVFSFVFIIYSHHIERCYSMLVVIQSSRKFMKSSAFETFVLSVSIRFPVGHNFLHNLIIHN